MRKEVTVKYYGVIQTDENFMGMFYTKGGI